MLEFMISKSHINVIIQDALKHLAKFQTLLDIKGSIQEKSLLHVTIVIKNLPAVVI
jgi:hypothetical protein